MQNQKLLSLALVAILATGVAVTTTACSSNRTVGTQIDDGEITASVKSRLLADPDVAGLDINVDTANAVVTLSGMVKTAGERDEAVRVARGTEHVRRVVNKLTLGND